MLPEKRGRDRSPVNARRPNWLPAVPSLPGTDSLMPIRSTVKSFYITGGTLPRDASSYVSRHADVELLDGLQAGQFCYVLNARQMGKSSLMVRVAQKLKLA